MTTNLTRLALAVREVDEGLSLGFKESSSPFSKDFSESERRELKLAGEMLLELIKLFLDMVLSRLWASMMITAHNWVNL